GVHPVRDAGAVRDVRGGHRPRPPPAAGVRRLRPQGGDVRLPREPGAGPEAEPPRRSPRRGARRGVRRGAAGLLPPPPGGRLPAALTPRPPPAPLPRATAVAPPLPPPYVVAPSAATHRNAPSPMTDPSRQTLLDERA